MPLQYLVPLRISGNANAVDAGSLQGWCWSRWEKNRIELATGSSAALLLALNPLSVLPAGNGSSDGVAGSNGNGNGSSDCADDARKSSPPAPNGSTGVLALRSTPPLSRAPVAPRFFSPTGSRHDVVAPKMHVEMQVEDEAQLHRELGVSPLCCYFRLRLIRIACMPRRRHERPGEPQPEPPSDAVPTDLRCCLVRSQNVGVLLAQATAPARRRASCGRGTARRSQSSAPARRTRMPMPRPTPTRTSRYTRRTPASWRRCRCAGSRMRDPHTPVRVHCMHVTRMDASALHRGAARSRASRQSSDAN